MPMKNAFVASTAESKRIQEVTNNLAWQCRYYHTGMQLYYWYCSLRGIFGGVYESTGERDLGKVFFK